MDVLLDVKDLNISFGGVHAVNNLSFKINKGEILGLIGPNGSGKSTCVNIISGVHKQDSGTIFYNNAVSLKKQKIYDRARMGIGRTYQSPRPFGGMTVYDSVFSIALLYNKKPKAHSITKGIIEAVGFSGIIDTPSSKLPIEKRKWLDMARVLAISPELIMLDECLAGLTPYEMDKSIELIKRLNKEQSITVLFIEHVMKAVVHLCTRVVVLNEGSLLAEGSPDVVMNNPAVIEAYLGREEDTNAIGIK